MQALRTHQSYRHAPPSSRTGPHRTSSSSAGFEAGTLYASIRRIEEAQQSGVRIAMRGEFDIFNWRDVCSELEACASYRTITVDFGAATFIDASILRTLAQFAGRRRASHAQPVHIFNANPHLRKLFAICGLEHAFAFSSEAAPVAGLE